MTHKNRSVAKIFDATKVAELIMRDSKVRLSAYVLAPAAVNRGCAVRAGHDRPSQQEDYLYHVMHTQYTMAETSESLFKSPPRSRTNRPGDR